MIAKTETLPNNHQIPTELRYIPMEVLLNAAEDAGLFIALADKYKVQKGRNHKAPSISWDKNPTKYKGLDDPNLGTAIRCGYINDLKKWLVVIDLDIPKNDEDIPLEVLKKQVEPILRQTYSTRTPSGGIHIYLLNNNKPALKQPPKNIDYQTTTGDNKGKYIVMNYRWNKEGTAKEYYNKLSQSPDEIAIMDSDGVMEDIIEKLTEKGYIKTPAMEHQEKIINLFQQYYREGTRDEFSLSIAGYLRKQGYQNNAVKNIVKMVFAKDEELQKRLKNVDQTYQKPSENIMGYSWLKEHMAPRDLDQLTKLTENSDYDLKTKIIKYLSKNKEPSAKLLADYINSELELYKNLDTFKYYERTNTGEFIEINESRIIEFCNQAFGFNSISHIRCVAMLKHITRPVKKNYNLVEFTNGILNTNTKEFIENKTLNNETPKLSLNFEWNPKATPGKISTVINQILDHLEHPDDKELWLRTVGHAFMATNRIGRLVMVQGPSGTGKSTLTTILMRIFNYSNLPISTINANERFTLHTMVDRDVNITDDINDGILKGIGPLNTIVTGNGLEVEVKGENRTIQAKNPQIPRLFANGNTLPPVIGEGFQRRLLLIHALNEIEEMDENLQMDILNGLYDKEGLEWLVYTSINTYWERIDEPLTSKKEEARMKEEYEFKSYPLKKGIEALFVENYTDGVNIPVREVNMWVKAWCIWAYNSGKISKEHRKPSQRQISKAMDNAGYNQTVIRITKETGNDYENTTQKVYEDIVFNRDKYELLLKPYLNKEK